MHPRRPSAYHDILGDSPVCEAGDRAAARAYLDKIDRAIEIGGWSAGERARLYRMRDKWAKRAEGRDPRFNVVGTRAGRLSPELEQHIAALEKAQAKRDKQAQGRRSRRKEHIDWEKYEDLDLPWGRAQGGPSDDDGAADLDEHGPSDFGDEAGEMAGARNGSPWGDRDFLVPGQDQKGHSQRIQCRVIPGHYRALCAIYAAKQFPFRTLGDVMRWAIDRGIRELTRMKDNVEIESLMRHADVIKELALEEQFYQDFGGAMDAVNLTVNRHMAAGAVGEARRHVAMIKAQILRMKDGYWREKYLGELKSKFGHLLDGDEGVSLLSLMPEEGDAD